MMEIIVFVVFMAGAWAGMAWLAYTSDAPDVHVKRKRQVAPETLVTATFPIALYGNVATDVAKEYPGLTAAIAEYYLQRDGYLPLSFIEAFPDYVHVKDGEVHAEIPNDDKR